METTSKVVTPGPDDRSVRNLDGSVSTVPADWQLLPPGDAGLTRRVKAAGPSWTMQEKKGRRTFSRGVWAPAERIAAVKAELDAERSTDSYKKRRKADAKRREVKHREYVGDFRDAVLAFLKFDASYAEVAERLADAVAEHATPVGSGTVARTQRITIEQRAESAVIAWLRHRTTAYDHIKIARVKGKRREVRRALAEQSRRLLGNYRNGYAIDRDACPLYQGLANGHVEANE